MFQTIALTFKTPSGPKEITLVGTSPFTEEEWNAIAEKPLQETLTAFKISKPIHVKDLQGDYDALIHSAAEDETN